MKLSIRKQSGGGGGAASNIFKGEATNKEYSFLRKLEQYVTDKNAMNNSEPPFGVKTGGKHTCQGFFFFLKKTVTYKICFVQI